MPFLLGTTLGLRLPQQTTNVVHAHLTLAGSLSGRELLARLLLAARALLDTFTVHLAVDTLAVRAVAQQFYVLEGQMNFEPVGPAGAVQAIGARDQNLLYSVDFSARIPQGKAISSHSVQISSPGLSDDRTAELLVSSSFSSPIVTLILGTGTQQPDSAYRIHVTATLNNTPPSVIAGYFDLPCLE